MPVMPFNTDTYLCHLEGLDLSLDEKRDIIRAMHAIMEEAIDVAFGTHPVQLAQTEKNLQAKSSVVESYIPSCTASFSQASSQGSR
jgi:hypothetical protein